MIQYQDWAQLAAQWSTPLTRPNLSLIQSLWANLEAESFAPATLSQLDDLQVLENCLWPNANEDSSNQQIILITYFINHKKQARLPVWSCLFDGSDRFSQFFQRLLSINLDTSLPVSSKLAVLNLFINLFQSLEQDTVRKECAPLVSIAIWENLHSENYRESLLDLASNRRKAWRSVRKRFENAEEAVQVRLRLERAWLFSIIVDFAKRINNDDISVLETAYCSRVLEFMIDLISQLPTRRYTIVLLQDLNFIPIVKLSVRYRKSENSVFKSLAQLYEVFACFELDDVGEVLETRFDRQNRALLRLQKLAMRHFESSLKVLALSNLAAIRKPGDLQANLETLSDLDLERLCTLLDIRTVYPISAGIKTGRDFFLESLVSRTTASTNLKDVISAMPIMPTEESLYAQDLLQNETYTGLEPLALPKLSMQYLTLNDFLWRSLQLEQAEAFFQIRKDIEAVAQKLNPRVSQDGATTNFGGFSRMAIPINKPAVIEVAPARIGESVPAYVRVELVLDVSRLGDKVRGEWDNLKPKDTVFLLGIKPVQKDRAMSNGVGHRETAADSGIMLVRTAEVVQMQDEKGRPIRDTEKENVNRSRTRRLLLNLDSTAFSKDKAQLSAGKPDVYNSINVVVRRPGRENNFRPVLETIQGLASSQMQLPAWLQDVYLGYGHPANASYPQIAERIKKLDFLDTFMDREHLQQSFPNTSLEMEDSITGPPFVLELGSQRLSESQNQRKRRREQMEDDRVMQMSVRVSSYRPKRTGPYPINIPRRNKVRFTPRQVEAIVSSTQPGLSLVVGPPGTGKTDVAVQTINLLYHNFPHERILLLAHSNQALNQLFQKLVALDIDPQHLLRLGHGEGELDTEESFGRAGRVESFMQDRAILLAEVSRLAASLAIIGAHGSSCETADYFDKVYIQPLWQRFQTAVSSPDISKMSFIQAFPFHSYFSNAPIPELFAPELPLDELREIAEGCYHHISTMFSRISAIRPFELLRNPRDQQNYLLSTSARIIAMTTTHAAIHHSSLRAADFTYHSVVLEEAAQITEVESFIPLSLQEDSTNLKRIVLLGDHLQNSPIVQNHALREYANLDQSLFLRLVRLGVPHTILNAQGRCRPQLTPLFSWRYPSLTDLPHTSEQPEFRSANAGLRYPLQFINIEPNSAFGNGETSPQPHFLQNLAEAEYAVALYQYMRLLNYPASSISILTTYAGQRALIRDILAHRCRNTALFGLPRYVGTVDKYQGEQNDYIILSLVRTKSLGYLRDIRRLTVALSRARLGLYVLGYRALFATCVEMSPAMAVFDGADGGRADERHLQVVTDEMYPTRRGVEQDVSSTAITGVEHLGQYVYEMTQAKISAMGGRIQVVDGLEIDGEAEVKAGLEDDDRDEEDEGEDDVLHEKVG